MHASPAHPDPALQTARELRSLLHFLREQLNWQPVRACIGA